MLLLAKFNAAIGDIRGKLGGVVFSTGPYGAYIRKKVSPVQPETPAQTLTRERLTNLAKAWAGELTPAQRGGWKNLASSVTFPDVFGNPQNLSGIALYQKVNLVRLNVGDARLDVAPISLEVRPLLSAELTVAQIGTSILNITVDDACEDNEAIYVRGAINVSPGVSFVQNKLRYFGTTVKGAATNFDMAIPTRFGAIAESAICWVRCSRYNEDNGAISPGIVANATSSA